MCAAELSVVLVAPSGMATIRGTIAGLRAQTVADRLEVLVVAPSADQIDPEELGASSFAAFTAVGTGPITRRGSAAATGILAASAPVVSLIENHSYPAPGWAAALLAAHRGGWAAVGPRVENANPLSSVSRVCFWLAYASLSGPQEAGVRTILPWHNTSYKRELLASFGQRLPDLLDMEGVLQAELIAAGRELFLEPEALIHHVNISKFSSAPELLSQRGRTIGGWNRERRRMAPWQRGLAALVTPLITVMRLRRLKSELGRAGTGWRPLLADGPTLAAGLVAMMVGEAVGYLAGTGDAIGRLEDFELFRDGHLTSGDQRAFFSKA